MAVLHIAALCDLAEKKSRLLSRGILLLVLLTLSFTSSAQSKQYRELIHKAQFRLEIGDSATVVKTLQSTKWDEQVTPELLMLYTGALNDSKAPRNLQKLLEDHPKSLRFSQAYWMRFKDAYPGQQ